jgi:hypothetical protein
VIVPGIVADDSELNRAERAFLEGVFACRGVREQPTESDFRQAMKIMIAYAQQVQDNPPRCAKCHKVFQFGCSR